MKPQPFDPGLTQQYSGRISRTINHDGSFNVRRRSAGWKDINLFVQLIGMGWWPFLGVIFGSYLIVNIIFAVAYFAIGADHIQGVRGVSQLDAFWQVFFFSAQTLTTVGYGHLAPVGILTSTLASIEAMVGLLGFALATGLLFTRFSRPSAKIAFSEQIVIAPYQGITALEFRIANRRANVLMDLEAQVLLMTVETVDGETKRRFIELELERRHVHFFPLTWTVVHPIDERSPLRDKDAEALSALQAEVLILIRAFDDTFGQVVHARYSYRHDEFKWQAKFRPAFYLDNDGEMVLDLDRLNDTVAS